MNGEDPLLVLLFDVAPPHSLEKAQVVFLNGFGVALGAELAHLAVWAEEEWKFPLPTKRFDVVENPFRLRDEGREDDLGSIEFLPVNNLPVGRHNVFVLSLQ